MSTRIEQLRLLHDPVVQSNGRNAKQNAILPEDTPVHGWYRFVLSFPPHLVRQYVDKFGVDETDVILDPFCGTGTTLVEAKKLGIRSVGIEAMPLSAFAANTKLDWAVDHASLIDAADCIIEFARKCELARVSDESSTNMKVLSSDSSKLLLKDSISPLPLHKCLLLLELIDELADERLRQHLRLALAATAVKDASNLTFGPEVGLGQIREDADVFSTWRGRVSKIAADLSVVSGLATVKTHVFESDAREMDLDIPQQSVSVVITSPPYPNEKDYSRTVRLESVLLGMFSDRSELRQTKQKLLRSNTRGVYKADTDDQLVVSVPEILSLADSIEKRRIELNKTSGFERLYSRVTQLYFGGMKRHFLSLIPFLKPGAKLAYVVGDQASYLRVHIKTGQLIAQIAESVGYIVDSIDLFRTRRATATRAELREEVVVMTWPGE